MINDEVIRIGIITGAHGLDGRVKVYVITDIVERFAPGSKVFISGAGGDFEYRIAQFTEQKGKNGLLRLEGVNDRDTAHSLKGGVVYIDKSVAEKSRNDYLDADSFYYYDLIGCEAYIGGESSGTVTDVFEAGAGSILVIKDRAGKERMVPFVESMVDTSGIKKGRLDIDPVEGLFDI